MLAFLAAAAEAADDYYPTMLIGMLRKETEGKWPEMDQRSRMQD